MHITASAAIIKALMPREILHELDNRGENCQGRMAEAGIPPITSAAYDV
jgi:hypothetical protein